MLEKSLKVFIMKARPTGLARCIGSVRSAYGLHSLRHGGQPVALWPRILMDTDSKVCRLEGDRPCSMAKRDLSADKAGNFARCLIVYSSELAASVPYLW